MTAAAEEAEVVAVPEVVVEAEEAVTGRATATAQERAQEPATATATAREATAVRVVSEQEAQAHRPAVPGSLRPASSRRCPHTQRASPPV